MRAAILMVALAMGACSGDSDESDGVRALEEATEPAPCEGDFGYPGIVCDAACADRDNRLDERSDLCGCPVEVQAPWGEWVGCCYVQNAGTAPHLAWEQCGVQ